MYRLKVQSRVVAVRGGKLLRLAGLCALWLGTGGAALAEPASASTRELRVVLTAAGNTEAEVLARQTLELIMQRAGLAYRLSIEPASRAKASWQAGLYDLDLARTIAFEAVAPGSVVIRPHLFTLQYVAIGQVPGRVLNGFGALRPLSVATLRGTVFLQEALRQSARLELVNSREACLGMAARGRVEVCVLPKTDVVAPAKRPAPA